MKKALMFKKYINQGETQHVSDMWKLNQSLFPKKTQSLPSSKFNHRGKLVSEPAELIKLLGTEYGKIRLRKRPSHPMHLKMNPIRRQLIMLKLRSASKKKTQKFEMKDLDIVLKGLKGNKARDPKGIARTIFKTSVGGSNHKVSLLKLFNNIKTNQKILTFMRKATVTTIPKKGSKLELKNERGIILVSSVRSIFMRLLYNLKKQTLDSHMSDSNVGGRQNKSGINHIWVINAIMHDQVSSVNKKNSGFSAI